GSQNTAPLQRLLSRAARTRFRDADSLIRLHETALFLRAWPPDPEVAKLADDLLFSFAQRIADLPDSEREKLSDPTVSGISGTSLCAVFTWDVARRLADLHPESLRIAWDACDNPDRLSPLMARLLPLMAEDWPVEAHVPYREWIASAIGNGSAAELA